MSATNTNPTMNADPITHKTPTKNTSLMTYIKIKIEKDQDSPTPLFQERGVMTS
jgi:hypothetical protein